MQQGPESTAGSTSRDAAATRLLEMAEDASLVGLPLTPNPLDIPPRMTEFLQTYREWIALERGALGTREEQVEQWQMLVYCMISASKVEEASQLFVRFARLLWKDRAPKGLFGEGDAAALVFNEPLRSGAEGLVAELWMLSLMMSTLEFLAGIQARGAAGRVRYEALVPANIARMLFDAPVAYGEAEAALVLPRSFLERPIVAQAADLPGFFRELLPLTLGAGRGKRHFASLVASLIRDALERHEFPSCERSAIAAKLGISESSLGRRLEAEGTGFRALRDQIRNDRARHWLAFGDTRIDEIADRLGFSDGYAFRRSFRRLNGLAPADYRRVSRRSRSG